MRRGPMGSPGAPPCWRATASRRVAVRTLLWQRRTFVPKQIPNYLRLHTEELPALTSVEQRPALALEALSQAFCEATGWTLAYDAGPAPVPDSRLIWSAPVDPGEGATPGHFRLEGDRPREGAATREAAVALAAELARLATELARAHRALWQREAELAAGVPVQRHPHEPQHVAECLQTVLASAAQAVGCQAAALYLLDEHTTSLKLRALYGLSANKLADPPRPLEGAVADLEALLGHAVVLEEPGLFDLWRAPECFAGAVCVPVSTSTVPLGTLWFFTDQRSTFGDEETGVMEIAAGRIAVELERQMLLTEGLAGARLRRQFSAAERAWQSQAGAATPHIDGWDIAGWSNQSERLGGSFVDCWQNPAALPRLALGNVAEEGLAGALAIGAVRWSARAHAAHVLELPDWLPAVAADSWAGSWGDLTAHLAAIEFSDSQPGAITLAVAGELLAFVCSPGHWRDISAIANHLGEEPVATYGKRELILAEGETLVVVSGPLRTDDRSTSAPLASLAETVLDNLQFGAPALAELLHIRLEREPGRLALGNLALWVVRRRTSTKKSS